MSWMGEGRPRLAELLARGAQAAVDQVGKIDPDYLLTENLDVTVNDLLARHLPAPVSVEWESPTRTEISETEIRREESSFGERQVRRIPARQIRVSWPLTGAAEVLRHQASQFTLGPQPGTITDQTVALTIEAPTLTAEYITSQITEMQQSVEKRVTWANTDIQNAYTAADTRLRREVEARRQRILENRQLDSALAIPVASTSAARPPVPAKRRQVTLQQRRASAEFTPEPLLDEAIYQDILNVVENWARSLERTCTAPIRELGEEALRDLLLGTLNGYWRGAASGELFNGAGKTDILIREDGRNAFIAECKVWDGPAKATAALDQLLSYLVWRDTKAALIVFIKKSSASGIIDRLHQAVREHPRHVLTAGSGEPESRCDYIFTADDADRRIELAVLPVVLLAP